MNTSKELIAPINYSQKYQPQHKIFKKVSIDGSDMSKTQLQSQFYQQGLENLVNYNYARNHPDSSESNKKNALFTPLYFNSLKTSSQNKMQECGKQSQNKHHLELISKQSLKQQGQSLNQTFKIKKMQAQSYKMGSSQPSQKLIPYKQKININGYYFGHLQTFTSESNHPNIKQCSQKEPCLPDISSLQEIINQNQQQHSSINKNIVDRRQYRTISQSKSSQSMNLPLVSYQNSKYKHLYLQQEACDDRINTTNLPNQQKFTKWYYELDDYNVKQINQTIHLQQSQEGLQTQQLIDIKTKPYLNLPQKRQQAIQNLDNVHFLNKIKQLKEKIKHLQSKCNNLQRKQSDISSYLSETSQRYNQLIEQNVEINSLLRQYKEQLYKFQTKQEDYLNKLSQSQNIIKQLRFNLEQKQNDIDQLVLQYRQQLKEIQELNEIIKEQNQKVNRTDKCFKEYKKEVEVQMDSMRNKVEDYENRFQKEGLTFDIQEAAYIRKMLQQNTNIQFQKYQLTIESKNYQIKKLQSQKQDLQSNLQQLQTKILSYEVLQQILQEYDMQLQKRDEQIIELKMKINKFHELLQGIQYKNSLSVVNKLQLFIKNIYDLGLQHINYQLVYHNTNLINALRLAEMKIHQDHILINNIYHKLDYQERKHEKRLNKLNKIIQDKETALYDMIVFNLAAKNKRKIALSNRKSLKRSITNKKSKHSISSSLSKPSIINVMYQTPIKNKMEVNATLKNSKAKKVLAIESLPQQITYHTQNHEATLEKIIISGKLNNPIERLIFIKQLTIFVINTLSNSKRKLRTLNPSEIMVDRIESTLRFRMTYQGNKEETLNQKYMIYQAPQVLLGFSQSQCSYVWTLGIFLDIIEHTKLYYKKISEIICFQNNYICTRQNCLLKPLLQNMLKKDKKVRPKLKEVLDFIINIQ